MKKTLIASSIGLALATGSASAADLYPLKEPPPPPSYSWTGCYLNAGIGYGFVGERTTLSEPSIAFTDIPLDQSEQGWLGRFGGGCDVQFSSVVVGAFADYDASRINGLHTGDNPGNIGLVNGQQTMPRSWAAGGRIGYLVTPRLLTYFDGGWTQAQFSSVAYVDTIGFPTGDMIPAETYRGWFIGGGTEYALDFGWLPIHGLFWRNEYRFSGFQSQNLPVIATATGLSTGNFELTKPTEQTITTSLVWRFNFGGPSSCCGR
jgi:outer membrane immunogenic protein